MPPAVPKPSRTRSWPITAPGLSQEELWFRMRGVLAVTAVDRVEAHQRPTPDCPSPDVGEAARRWAVTFLAAAMSAPPTGP
ncbi:hypothetical protein GCM10026982_10700 [Nocardiopsis aegyptia]